MCKYPLSISSQENFQARKKQNVFIQHQSYINKMVRAKKSNFKSTSLKQIWFTCHCDVTRKSKELVMWPRLGILHVVPRKWHNCETALRIEFQTWLEVQVSFSIRKNAFNTFERCFSNQLTTWQAFFVQHDCFEPRLT